MTTTTTFTVPMQDARAILTELFNNPVVTATTPGFPLRVEYASGLEIEIGLALNLPQVNLDYVQFFDSGTLIVDIQNYNLTFDVGDDLSNFPPDFFFGHTAFLSDLDDIYDVEAWRLGGIPSDVLFSGEVDAGGGNDVVIFSRPQSEVLIEEVSGGVRIAFDEQDFIWRNLERIEFSDGAWTPDGGLTGGGGTPGDGDDTPGDGGGTPGDGGGTPGDGGGAPTFDESYWTGLLPAGTTYDTIDIAGLFSTVPEQFDALVDLWIAALNGTVYADAQAFLEAVGLLPLISLLPDVTPDGVLADTAPLAPIVAAIDVSDALQARIGAAVVEIGASEADLLTGGEAGDFLVGQLGDDTLEGGLGNDLLDGGEGLDKALFAAAQQFYTLALSAEGVTVTDRREGGEGTDSLFGIETLSFDGADFLLTEFDDLFSLDPAVFTALTEVYLAFFNRAPDALGKLYWADKLGQPGSTLTLETIASTFADSPEAQQAFPGIVPPGDGSAATPEQFEPFAQAIFQNLRGRDFDAPGLAFWTKELADGSVTVAEFVLNIIETTKAGPASDADPDTTRQALADQAYLSAKADLGLYFSSVLGMSDGEDAATALGLYDGTPESVDAAVAAIDALYQAASSGSGGDFLIELVGLVDNPFAG